MNIEVPKLILEAPETLNAPQDVSKWKNADYKEFFSYMGDLNTKGRKMGIYAKAAPETRTAIYFFENLILLGEYAIAENVINEHEDPDFEFTFPGTIKENNREVETLNRVAKQAYHPKLEDLEVLKMMLDVTRKFLKLKRSDYKDTTYAKIIDSLVRPKKATIVDPQGMGFYKRGLYSYLTSKTKESQYEVTPMFDFIDTALKRREKGGIYEKVEKRRREFAKVPPPPPLVRRAAEPMPEKTAKQAASEAMSSVREVLKIEGSPKMKKQFVERLRKELDDLEKSLIPKKELDRDFAAAKAAVAKARALRKKSQDK